METPIINLPNVFESDFNLPPKVCIVAPGPNGKGHYAQIPADFCVIAVAKAILNPEVRADIWMMTHSHQDWYAEADAGFEGVRIYSYDAAMRVLSSLSGRRIAITFKPHPDLLDPNGGSSIEGVIRYGGTIVGNAIQLAYNFGVTEILLCGADMSGDGYWDGTVNRERVHGNVWIAVSYLNPLLSWLMNQKHIRISTLSQTRLDVPAYRPSDRKAR